MTVSVTHKPVVCRDSRGNLRLWNMQVPNLEDKTEIIAGNNLEGYLDGFDMSGSKSGKYVFII